MNPRYQALAVFLVASLWAQTPTTVDLRKQSRNVDFRDASFTRPFKTGTTLPANCTPAETFFKTDAITGANLYGCTSPGVWSVLGSGEPANPNIQAHIAALGAVHGAASQASPNTLVVRDASGNAALHNLSTNTLEVGDGTIAGEMALYELAVNGSEYRSWLAPDSLTATVKFRFPDAVPVDGQVMRFAAPVSNISAVTFQDANAHTHSAAQIQAKVTQTIHLPTVGNAAGTASLAGGWSTPNTGGPARTSLGNGSPGVLQFDDTAQYATVFFYLPNNWDGIDLSLILIWAPAGSGGTNVTVRWQHDLKCVAPGAVIEPPSFTPGNNTDVTVASASSVYYMRTSITPALAGCAAGNLAYLRLWRDGPNDSFTGSVYLQALEVGLKVNLE